MSVKACSHQASASAASLAMYRMNSHWSHSQQASAAVASLAMTLGIALGPISIFDASDDSDAAAAADDRCEQALKEKLYKSLSHIFSFEKRVYSNTRR